ncbi:cytoplasmic export protein 1 [[Candida] jaroonii]|uniref:Cytoplasmic export protein 1 n=1 Tax=[Candida] jaroonii TaxID=467808 RepID=A0ACA9Y471_9ASCO|nr:cytoplasmic export protein 1 [[Candida] jaroonii]
MNFLSKTLSTLTGTSIPYTFKEKIENQSVWTLYDGVNPKDNSSVTIFEINLRDQNILQSNYDQLAKNTFKKSKLIKFPELINTIDFIENDNNLYIITEPVVPLSVYLNSHNINNDSKILGLYNIANSLEFLNLKCNYVHGNVNVNSIYVNKEGDWKLFGFEFLTNLQSDPDQPIYRFSRYLAIFNNSLPDDVLNQGIDVIRPFPIKFDSYCFGKLIEVLFDNRINDKSLSSLVRRLTNPKINLRITIDKFLADGASIFKNNLLIEITNDLKDLKFKNNDEKLNYFKYNLANYFDSDSHVEFPPGFLENRLLPELILQYSIIEKFKPSVNSTNDDIIKNQESLAILLNYILKFGNSLGADEFNKSIKPIIFKTFASTDRSIRLILLNHLNNFERNLSESDVQSRIFYNLISGFQDTNFMIRETTLTSINLVIDKISVKQINQDLLKILAKSQMDPKPSIRVNTLILIIKIQSKIYNNSKNNVLITALSKSLKDTFTPCKMTALQGFEKLITEFSLEEICTKILGQLAISLMDKQSVKVRNQARKVFQLYLDAVETNAKNLPVVEEDEELEEKEFFKKFAPNVESEESNDIIKETNSNSGFSFGWNVVNKLVSTSVLEGQLNNDFNNSNVDLTTSVDQLSLGKPNQSSMDNSSNAKLSNVNTKETNGWDDNFDDVDDGWGMDEVKDEVETDKIIKKPVTRKVQDRAKKPGGLKLGKDKDKKPISNLRLNLSVDDDSWGGSDDW